MIIKIIIVLYGVLSLIASIAQGAYKNVTVVSASIMGFGGALMIFSIFIGTQISIYVLVVGVALAHVSAIINGYEMYGKINKSHHFIRLLISMFLVISHAMAIMK